MTDRPADDAVLIRDPFNLLYWLFFRGLALRRYARGIHADLDEDLKVWEVRGEVGDDPRFRALCRARLWLLASIPVLILLLTAWIALGFNIPFSWRWSLFSATGYIIGTFLDDRLRWSFPSVASHWFNRFAWILMILGFGLFLIRSIMNRGSSGLSSLSSGENISIYVALLLANILFGIMFGIRSGVTLGLIFGTLSIITFGAYLVVILGMM